VGLSTSHQSLAVMPVTPNLRGCADDLASSVARGGHVAGGRAGGQGVQVIQGNRVLRKDAVLMRACSGHEEDPPVCSLKR